MPAVLPLTRRGPTSPRAAEFFAGVGLARLGLERAGFAVTWSNDLDADKRAMYLNHFGPDPGHRYDPRDIALVRPRDLPADLDLAWASFPCTDLSLAGRRAGLAGRQSGAFWSFTALLEGLGRRRPAVVALENVPALATSRGGADLAAAIAELNRLGYSADLVVLDARRFVPQSRARLFVVAASDPAASVALAPDAPARERDPLRPAALGWVWDDARLRTHRAVLPTPPPPLDRGLATVVERVDPADPRWWDEQRLAALLSSLSPLQRERVEVARRRGALTHRTAYRRTREGVAVWEVRGDEIAGCLRTARGGSSKQALVQMGRGRVRARWMTSTEYARLMGADQYRVTGLRDSQALFGFGDAVCVPAVAWLADTYLMPLALGGRPQEVGAPPVEAAGG
jgi:DNA (cytosine-5)-methyltransferase 1